MGKAISKILRLLRKKGPSKATKAKKEAPKREIKAEMPKAKPKPKPRPKEKVKVRSNPKEGPALNYEKITKEEIKKGRAKLGKPSKVNYKKITGREPDLHKMKKTEASGNEE